MNKNVTLQCHVMLKILVIRMRNVNGLKVNYATNACAIQVMMAMVTNVLNVKSRAYL